MKSAKTTLLTTLLVGTLDGLAAIIQFKLRGGDDVFVIFKFIASGVFGNDAFSGGNSMVFFGVLFHYTIAAIWTLLFFLIRPMVSLKWPNKYITGVVYGVLIWVVMNLVVLPLSNTPALPRTPMRILTGIAILVIAVGLPISLIQSRKRSD